MGNGVTTRISLSSDGAQGDNDSYWQSISADGRYVAFYSLATNLVSDDTNNVDDVFVYDQLTGQTVRVSESSDGTQSNDTSWNASISADGRYVAYASYSPDLVSNDTNNAVDVFLHDRQTAETTRVSVATDGAQANDKSGASDSDISVSADGRYIAFGSNADNLVSGDTNGVEDIFIHDRITAETTLVSVATDGTQGNGDSHLPSISSDGRYVAFYSSANNLVSGDTNDTVDIFIYDRQTAETSLVSLASDGIQSNGTSLYPSISADGQYVAFLSYADNLVSGDTNGKEDIFVRDRLTGQTERISVSLFRVRSCETEIG